MLRRFVVRLAPSIRPPPGSEGAVVGRKISEEQRAAVGESLQDSGLNNLSQAERRELEDKHRTAKNAEHAADARAKREKRDRRDAVSIHRGAIRAEQVQHAQVDMDDIVGSSATTAARISAKHHEGTERAAREFRKVGATKKQFLKKKVEDDDDLF